MTKRRSDEPDNKAAERLKQFREARGIPENFPEEETESPEEKPKKPIKTTQSDEGTEG